MCGLKNPKVLILDSVLFHKTENIASYLQNQYHTYPLLISEGLSLFSPIKWYTPPQTLNPYVIFILLKTIYHFISIIGNFGSNSIYKFYRLNKK